MIYQATDYLYRIAPLFFFGTQMFFYLSSIIVPLKFIFKKRITNYHLIFSIVFLLVFFYVYTIYMEKIFYSTLVINIYHVIFGMMLFFSIFNIYVYGKSSTIQFVLFSLSLFLTVWTTICQFLTIFLFNYFPEIGLYQFSFLVFLGGIIYTILYQLLFQRIIIRKWMIYLIVAIYGIYIFLINTLNILIFTIHEGELKIVVGNTFIGKTLIASLAQDNLLIYRDFGNSIYLIILFLLFSAIPIFFVIRLVVKQDIDEKKYLEQKKREDELKTYVVMIESINRDFRKLKHDTNNIFSTLEGYLNETNASMVDFKDYFTKVQHEFGVQKTNMYPTINLEYIKDPEVMGLLLNKIMKAKELNTSFTIEITEPIRLSRALMLDLVRITGILLDNALEESTKMDEGYTKIAFIKADNNILLIRIRNSHDNPEFLNQYLSSNLKSSKGEDRGYGLEIVNELIKKNRQLHLECKQTTETIEFSLLIKQKGRSGQHG